MTTTLITAPDKKLGKQTWKFTADLRILASAVVGGPMEGQGPLAKDFDILHDNLYIGEESWEKAERKLFKEAAERAIQKSGLSAEQIEMFLGGDLLNQNISATFTAREMTFPFIGMYGACSTSMETLAVASALVDAGFVKYALAGCSSHNATAERQYRYPTEYGGQKPPTAQWTVTGAGAAVVGKGSEGPQITMATIGKVIDMGIKDPFDMGSAMAPAAADTIAAHFQDTGRQPSDYDLIVTGDLASVGLPIAKKLLAEKGYDMDKVFNDCGLMVYSPNQPVFAGGSGCASSAVTTYGHLMKRLLNNDLKRLLVVATGALLSPISYQQKESIPCIAHAVAIEMN